MVPGHEAREGAVRDYGLQVLSHGINYHSDRRVRVYGTGVPIEVPPYRGRPKERGRVRAFSKASQRRLEFIAANAGTLFKTLLTLTYHAPGESWADRERNWRVARRSKADLNRFLSCLRRELGAYVWVQEFQSRGVVHYHVLCGDEISDERVKVAWCRATDALGDGAALRHAAQAEPIRGEREARHYVGRYLGKQRQKLLPPGVERAGRWWGRSRSMELVLLDQAVTSPQGSEVLDPVAVRVVRGMRSYLSKRLGWKFRGGSFVNWGGALCDEAQRVMGGLRAFYAGGQA
jgi:hypothetical protein